MNLFINLYCLCSRTGRLQANYPSEPTRKPKKNVRLFIVLKKLKLSKFVPFLKSEIKLAETVLKFVLIKVL